MDLQSQNSKKQKRNNSSLPAYLVLPQQNEMVQGLHCFQKGMSHRRVVISKSHQSKLADSSKAGWGLIAKYQMNDEAYNSKDDKRMRQAEEHSLKKEQNC